jgi:putative tricarboxylic transport membrane protein
LGSLDSLLYGFGIALTFQNILYCFLGVLLGTLVGVLPGLGPCATISLLLPIVIYAPPVSALILLAGIYYGAQYGGSTTSILLNIPGEVSSVVTCLDGHQMALRGRAGPALGIAAFGSFIAGTLAIVGLMLFAPALAGFALRFGPPEFFSLAVMGISLVSYLSRESLVKSLIMACVGLIMSMVGQDNINARARFTFGIPALADGIDLIYVAMGLFGLSEVIENIGRPMDEDMILSGKIKGLLPSLKDWKDSIKPIFRGTFIGFFLGIIPGIGNTITTFMSYAVEKKYSKHPETFGTGAIEGVAGPESANNASSTGTFVPLLSLGIPANPTTAVFLGVLIMLGVNTGPLLISSTPDLFWGLVASMYIGNVMLLVLNLPLIPLWVKVLKVPYSILSVLIILLCLIGAYSVNNSVTDVFLMCFFGLVGYYMKRYKFPGAPLMLALVLGPMLESSFRRSLLLSYGSPTIFFTRPISAICLLVAFVSLASPVLLKKRIKGEAIDTQ